MSKFVAKSFSFDRGSGGDQNDGMGRLIGRAAVWASAAGLVLAGVGTRAGRAEGESSPTHAFYKDVGVFADWCRGQGLLPEARRSYAYLLEVSRRGEGLDSLGGLAETGLKKLLDDPFVQPAPGARGMYRQKVLDLVTVAAGRYASQAERLRAAGTLEKAEEAVRIALAIYEDCPPARAWKGEERVEGFGWLPREEARALAARTVDLARLPPPSAWAALDASHRQWADAWVVRTPHYAIRSNKPLAEIVARAKLCEMFHTAFFDLARGACAKPSERLGIYWLADQADYDRYLAAAMKDSKFSAHQIAGFYDHASRICLVQSRPSAEAPPGGAVSPEAGTMLHECVHQILHLAHAGSFPTQLPFIQAHPNEQVHFWAVEGIACLFEASRLEGGKLHLNRQGARYADLGRHYASGWRPDLARWMAMGQTRFMEETSAAANYRMAAGFAHFLVHCADGRKYRQKMFRLLSACYAGEAGLETFQEIFQMRFDLLAAEFERYVRETWPVTKKEEGE